MPSAVKEAPVKMTRPRGHGALANVLAAHLLEGMDRDHSTGERTVLLDRKLEGYRVLLIREASDEPIKLSLSPREREIVRMVARGLPNKAIAAVLEISCWTVGTHLRRIFAKMGVTCRAAMVGRLMEPGMAHLLE